MFLKWYLEIKEIVSLITDTGVLVFSRTDYGADSDDSETC